MGATRGRERNAVLLIDIENMLGGGKHPQALDIVQFMRAIYEHYRELVSEFAITRAYANWLEPYLREVRRELHVADIDPVQIFRFIGKVDNAADAEMIVDAISIAYERPELDVFVLATGDGAFAPVATKLHELGRTVVGVSTPAATVSPYLLEVCDLFGHFDHASGKLNATHSKGPSLRSDAKPPPIFAEVSGFVAVENLPTTAEALKQGLLDIIAEAVQSANGAQDTIKLAELANVVRQRYGAGWTALAQQVGLTDRRGEPVRMRTFLESHFGADAIDSDCFKLTVVRPS